MIRLRPLPEIPVEVLEEAVERRRGWPARERAARDARLVATRRPAGAEPDGDPPPRPAEPRRASQKGRGAPPGVPAAQRADARAEAVQQSLASATVAGTANGHLTHPFGASTTSRTSFRSVSKDETRHRGIARAGELISALATATRTSTAGTERRSTSGGEELRWAVYREVAGARFERSDDDWEPFLQASARRVRELLTWDDERSYPRWRMIEAWTIAAHGPHMAAAGGFRLAFWREEADHHGPRLERALARYGRYAQVRPPGFPAGRTAGLAHFLTHHVQHQDGAERGMAYDVARFNQLTKQMARTPTPPATTTGSGRAARARRRQRASQLAEQINQRFQFRLPQASDGARLRVASELLDSDYPAHKAAGAKLYAAAMHEQRLTERDQRLLAGEHPGNADGRYQTACAYANRWGLPTPSARRASSSAQSADDCEARRGNGWALGVPSSPFANMALMPLWRLPDDQLNDPTAAALALRARHAPTLGHLRSRRDRKRPLQRHARSQAAGLDKRRRPRRSR